jgi:hypothetical protein
MQNAKCAGLAVFVATALASTAFAAPVVLDPNFTVNDTASNASFSNGSLFFVQNWTPTGFASNTNTDPGQYDNGVAGGQTVVGFLSGASASLSQVVNGFIVGRTYQVSVGANARSSVGANPTFDILANNTLVYGPGLLTPVNSVGIFNRAFTPIQSDTFVAANTFVTITFANTSTSNANASTLLTNVSVSQVPEPISIAILGLGLAGIGIARRRRR